MSSKKGGTENTDKRPLRPTFQLRSQASIEANPEANAWANEERSGDAANPSYRFDLAELTAKITDTVGTVVEGKLDVINSKLDTIQATLDGTTKRLDEAESRISSAEDIIADMEVRLQRAESKILTLTRRVDDQETRSRRDNIRIFGVKEGIEGKNAISYFETWLPSLLNMKTKKGRFAWTGATEVWENRQWVRLEQSS
ncbi:hypothetical protein WMY93_029081 [Mugilogobius chulae]|uniref:Uncharacterized protein n=1 Tax=Mugilogobius chulae TaxID=88201 RepID=A0AAW0MQ61_9GOBI